jgi:hypothetical protein
MLFSLHDLFRKHIQTSRIIFQRSENHKILRIQISKKQKRQMLTNARRSSLSLRTHSFSSSFILLSADFFHLHDSFLPLLLPDNYSDLTSRLLRSLRHFEVYAPESMQVTSRLQRSHRQIESKASDSHYLHLLAWG